MRRTSLLAFKDWSAQVFTDTEVYKITGSNKTMWIATQRSEMSIHKDE